MGNQVTLVEGIPEDISSLFLLHFRPGSIVLDYLMRNRSNDERILHLFDTILLSTWKVFPKYISQFPLH